MAVLTVQTINLAGLDAPTLAAAAAAGDSFPNDGRTIFRVKNASGAPMTVTINSLQASDFGTDENIVVVVPATTGDTFIGPFNKARFNDANGRVGATYSLETSVTVAAIALDERGW